jgi:alkylated DNA repair protein (DNA oxidative demethylase)
MAVRRRREAAAEPPDGFRYVPDLLSEKEERWIIELVERLPFEPVVFRGVEARRRVVHLGHRYDFEERGLAPGLPIPPALLELRGRLAPIADRPAERFEEVLVTEYRPGATIGWHRDAPAFGSTVLGVSLASACRMRFRREVTDGWETWEATLEPRSAYLLSGAARSTWRHSIPPTPALRYSITYRTIRSRHRSATS